jgi:hypothetical protein
MGVKIQPYCKVQLASVLALAQNVPLKLTRRCARRIGNDYSTVEKTENEGVRTTPERELFSMPPKRAWEVTANRSVETY